MAKDRLYVLFNVIRTIHDEKIVEPNMESRKTDLSDKIMKLAKIIKSWNPDPRKGRSHAHAQTITAPEICTIQQNIRYERNTY